MTQTVESRTRHAQRKLRNVQGERKVALGGGPSAEEALSEAQRLESKAADLMKPACTPVLRSGEVLRLPGLPDDAGPVWEIANTLRDPDQAAWAATADD
jgi:hypothetical protein